ncbi:MAG: ATP-binding protein, partial [Actinomycetota bacterium]|nr:ATP-binding protein [Actinomycetota bacterium]
AQAQAALAAARDGADAANRAKSDFLSRMSHELRTPLNAILGFGQLLQLDGLTPDQQDSVDQILRGGRHLLDLINEVLDISRIESGRMRLSVEPVNLAEVLDDCLDLVRPLAVAASVDIAHTTPPECRVHVAADKQRLKQALLNLLANAIKYNRPQGRAWVACESVGNRVRVHVADTGIGIAAHELDRLFVPFERLNGAVAKAVEGTGLGLALAKRLVEAMGGTLEVDAGRDDGTTFTIELQAASPDGAVASPDGEFGSSFEPANSTEATVLYVEDNASNVRLVERILVTRPKVRLVTASNGTAGLEAAFQHHPDIVLLDLHLPDGDGRDVLRRLKGDARTASTPVVIISADATEVQRSGLIQAGAVDYLTKPLDVGTFLDLVDRLAPQK